MKLEIDSDNVLAAAKLSPAAKKVLMVLFPDLFVESEYLYKRLLVPGTKWKHTIDSGSTYLYLGDSMEMGRTLGMTHKDSFFSLDLTYGLFVQTPKDSKDIIIVVV